MNEKKNVNVIWHHHPGAQFKAHAMEKAQGLLDYACNIRVPKMAFATATIQI